MFCSNCGNKLAEGSKFCSVCGSKVVIGNVSNEMETDHNIDMNLTSANNYKPIKQKPRRIKRISIGISAVAVLCLVIVIMVAVIGKKSEKPQYLISKTNSETQQKEINDKSNEETQQNFNVQKEEPQPDVDPGPQI